MTTFSVPHLVRPIDEAMFADLGYPTVSFSATADGGQQITVDATLTPAQIIRAKCRLLSVDAAREALLWAAYQAYLANVTFLSGPTPTAAQAIAQVTALTGQINGVLTYLLPDLSA